MQDLKNSIEKFVNGLNVEFPERKIEYSIEYARKFAKITYRYNSNFINSGSSSTWGFIALSEFEFGKELLKPGDLLKAASYKKPAKGQRGNILDLSAMYDAYGPLYMDSVNELRSFGKKLELI